MLFLRGFILGLIQRTYALLKNGSRDFQNNPGFERSACSYGTINETFERLQCLSFETKFLKNENLFHENRGPFSSMKF